MSNDLENIEEPTTNKPFEIQRISKDNVLKICSAQVILSLGIAVKELVENSIDAGATIIEVKIKNYGYEGFEVVDNGSGVLEVDFEGITAKHHTSKLSEFSDLERIKTLGFRGEALSSLCAISDVTILTRHKNTEFGTLLHYGNDGKILSKTTKARNVGTTVSVTNFFKTLPVRRTEFSKNYRREYNKMIQLLQEYCLVLVGVKIICTNQPKSGAKQTIITTNGQTIKDNITSIFGAKQSNEIIELKIPTNDGTKNGIYTQESLLDINSPTDLKDKDIELLNSMKLRIEGLISDIDHSCGRTTKDRQFTYINSRPVELKNALKTINEMYQVYNLKQYPFVFVNIKIDQSNVDVNLSKDKRQVAIANDVAVQAVLRKSLLETFGELPNKFRYTSINSVMKNYSGSGVDSDDDDIDDEDDKILVVEPNSSFGASLKQWKITPHAPFPKKSNTSFKRKLESSESSQLEKLQKIDSFLSKIPDDEDFDEGIETSKSQTPISLRPREQSQDTLNHTSSIESFEDEFLKESDLIRTSTKKNDNVLHKIDCKTMKSNCTLKLEFIKPKSTNYRNEIEELDDDNEKDEASESQEYAKIIENSSTLKFEFFEASNNTSNDNIQHKDLNESQTGNEMLEFDSPNLNETLTQEISVSLEQIMTDAIEEEKAIKKAKEMYANKSFKLKFKESIDPSKNKNAEAELETQIQKDMFKDMKVIGQFNRGFIITKLEDDLFIIDQHATDERYNFETLKESLMIESQKMINPEPLELTAIQEETIMQNLDIFEMNGFKFEIDERALPTQKIKLVSRPYSKHWEFGKEDIEEMIFMLKDAPNTHCRPSRIIKMLASRACRKSVMIGDSLDQKQMKELVTHMGEIQHPWNCPHGRPTIRYINNLSLINQPSLSEFNI